MTTEEKFRATVNVIRNLPKHGPVQPSNNVMLKFYGYFKQATEGPNTSPKPAFWDVVKRAKWDAWTKLGDMNSEMAMKLYVDEFKKIVESVSASNTNMDKAEIDNFYASVPMKDLELLVGPAVARSRSNSPTNEVKNSSEIYGHNESIANSSLHNTNKRINRSDDEEEDEYFLDTIESSDYGVSKNCLATDITHRSDQYTYVNGYGVSVSDDHISNINRFRSEDHETNLYLTKVITCLQKDLEKVVNSVNVIEQRIGQLEDKRLANNSSFSFTLTSPPVIAFAVLFTWPILLQLLRYWLRRRNRGLSQ